MNNEEFDKLVEFSNNTLDTLEDVVLEANKYLKLYYIACSILDNIQPLENGESWYDFIAKTDKEYEVSRLN